MYKNIGWGFVVLVKKDCSYKLYIRFIKANNKKYKPKSTHLKHTKIKFEIICIIIYLIKSLKCVKNRWNKELYI